LMDKANRFVFRNARCGKRINVYGLTTERREWTDNPSRNLKRI
jgi:hypothetical protein